MKKKSFWFVFFAFLFSGLCAFAVDVPYLTGRVTDHAGILSSGALGRITGKIKAHEGKTGNQIAVLTVPSLQGEGIEEYAVAVFKEWKLGQQGKDNGILVIIAPAEKRMRIEVGYGLEGIIPDGASGRIIRDFMTPRFGTDDFDGGIEAGVEAIISVLEKGETPKTQRSNAAVKESSGAFLKTPDMTLTEKILVGAFIFSIIGIFTALGVMTPGGGGWFLYFFLIPFWAMFPVIIFGSTGAFYLFIAYLVCFPIAKMLFKNSSWYDKAVQQMQKGQSGIGGFPAGSGRSGGSWSSGGSGFSGGGGRSGGGGASGSW